jgi:ankyrin repeat protein
MKQRRSTRKRFKLKGGQTPELIQAVEIGDVEQVDTILSKQVNVDEPDEHGRTAFWVAYKNKRKDILYKLMQAGADINQTDKYYDENGKKYDKSYHNTPLIQAVIDNDQELVESLLRAGANVNYDQDQGITALYFASASGNLNLVKRLLDAGANATTKFYYEASLLHSAIHDADIENTADEATRLEIIKLLVAAGADIHAVADEDMVANYVAHGSAYNMAIDYNYPIIAEFFANNGALDNRGLRLFHAAKFGNLEKINEILKTMSIDEINYQNDAKGLIPLYVASMLGYTPAVGALIFAGADVNISSKDGITPIAIASYKGRSDVVELLLNAGANPAEIRETANYILYKTPIERQFIDYMYSSNGSRGVKEVSTKIRLTFKFKGYQRSTVFKCPNIFDLKNDCVNIELYRSFDKHVLQSLKPPPSQSSLHANRPETRGQGNPPCFDPVLVSVESPVRVTSVDVLQVLSSKLKILIRDNIIEFEPFPISLYDAAKVGGVLISPYRILQGGLGMYEKYGYTSDALKKFRAEVMPTLKFSYVKEWFSEDRLKFLTETKNVKDDELVIDFVKRITPEEEGNNEICYRICSEYLDGSIYTLDESSDAWKAWNDAMEFVSVERLIEGGRRRQRRTLRRGGKRKNTRRR